jgi:gamma-glutamylcyclotransferase (GGCT)/AIG2-like uncharacterized protein YtfP
LECLFVYGTLLKEAQSEVLKLIQPFWTFESEGYLQGVLHNLGNYPAAVEDTTAQTMVKGEVYLLTEPAKIFSLLDEYEGINDYDPEYKREKKIVTLPGGRIKECWVYVYNKVLSPDLNRIASGDYLAFVQNKDNNG